MSGNLEAHIPALATAKLDSVFRWSRRRDLRRLSDILRDGEHVITLAQGDRSPWWYGIGYWLVVLTNRRLLMMRETSRNSILKDLPFRNIHSAEARSDRNGGKLTLSLAEGKLSVDSIFPKTEALRIADYLRQRMEQPDETEAFEQIKKLAELRDAGILTESEFQAKKAELLALHRLGMKRDPENPDDGLQPAIPG